MQSRAFINFTGHYQITFFFFRLVDEGSIARTDKTEVLTNDRVVEATEEAKAKAGSDGGALESVFSGALLSESFYRDLLRGHSAKGL